jgi:tetratricopeptide (TPR) repeat protein
VASVEGEDFTAEVVGQVRSMETRELVRRLSGELQREHRLVRARGLRRLEARRLALYRFQHHLFQGYLYNSLDEAERAYLHEDVGRVLEALYGGQTDEVAVQLARHFLEAGINDKAAHYLGRAGELAAARYANEEALAHLGRALELDPEMERVERFQLLLARQRVYDLLGDREAQLQDLAELEALADGLSPRQQAEAALGRATYAIQTGDYDHALAAAQLVVEQACLVGDTGLEARGHHRWAGALIHLGDAAGGEAHYRQALSLAQESGLKDLVPTVLIQLGRNAYHLDDDAASARAYLEEAQRLCHETADTLIEEDVVYELGVLSFGLGDYADARSRLERALHLARQIEDRRGEMLALGAIGSVCEDVGDYIGLQEFSQRALEIAREVEDRWNVSYNLAGLAEASRCLGDLTQASEYAEQALQVSREIGDVTSQAGDQVLLGHVCREQGELETAWDCYQQSLQVGRQQESGVLCLLSLAGLASTALARGNMTQARSHAAEILAFLDRGGTIPSWGGPFWIRLTCSRTLEAAGDPRAGEFLQQAYDLLMEQADRIGDEGMRRSFLENVPWNREIVALAEGVEHPT